VVDQKIQTIQHIEHALKDIGYRPKFIQRDYEYIDLFSYPPKIRTIDLGVFGREPFDIRSACFGFYAPKNGKPSESIVDEARALGAPQVFIVRKDNTERWVLTDKGRKFKDTFQTRNINKVISANREYWSPKSVLRAKCGFESPGIRQLDFIDFGFFPALEQEANKKLDGLIKRILSTTEKSSKKFNPNEIFNIVFCFLAAKLLKDRQIYTDPPIDFSFPEKTLEAISHYYGEKIIKPDSLCLQVISEEFKKCFSFRNLSVDSLTYVYENTFVSKQKREELGIHSTPSYIANYVLSKMPIEDIPKNRWKVLDPTCGHGIFLIAAMRRMRECLPEDWGGQKRHKFFANAICGVEIEPFAVEVAKLCLRLADFPERDGWKIINDDVFRKNVLEHNAGDTTILVGNPPFEIIKGKRPDTPKPVELLNRVLPNLPEGALVGLVLPRSFLDGLNYKNQRNAFLNDFEILSITNLPDQIFFHSNAETSIIIAKKHMSANLSKTSYYEVKNPQKKVFQFRNEVTWKDCVPQTYFNNQNKILVVPVLRELWETIKNYPKLREIADIRKGVQYEPALVKGKFHEIIRTSPFKHGKPGIDKVTESFSQFVVTKFIYLSTEKRLRRRNAWDLDWGKSKVIVPRHPLSSIEWKTAGVIDKKGLILYENFFAIWPKTVKVSVELIAALINSPLSNAFLYAHSNKRDLTKRLYASIPIPENLSLIGNVIEQLVKQYLIAVKMNKPEARDLLLQIDAEILKAYNLSPRLERQLLDLFWGVQRRVPFEFKGYIPPEEESWIPLHLYISKELEQLQPEKILKRMPVIKDQEFLDFLKKVGTESE